ncbi:MAG: hypothetical protein HY918_02660 [Candidatus Doudnabacteria bacterium]|nr:hypothetical protein [Candidatus Doudnabacteria bacterium]
MNNGEGFNRENGNEYSLHIEQTTEASAGVFVKFPKAIELAKFLAENISTWKKSQEENTYGHRDKFPVNASLPDGEKVKLYFKAKFNKTNNEHTIFGAKEQMAAAKFQIAEGNAAEGHKEVRWSSVLHELKMNSEASNRYLQRFGEELPIEEPIGFVVDKQGRKWSVFKFIENIIDLKNLPENLQATYNKMAKDFAINLSGRLTEIGINPQEIDKTNSLSPIMENVVFVGDAQFPDQAKPLIIDTEEWNFNH